MNQTFKEVTEAFDNLYDKGYRFLDSVEQQVTIHEQFGNGELKTSVVHKRLVVDGELLTKEEVERTFNFLAFRKSLKLRNGKPINLLGE